MNGSPDFGIFAPIVAAGGTIIAMGFALAVAWKGKSDWEPVEEDFPKLLRRIGGTVSACIVALIWVQWYGVGHMRTLTSLAAWCLGGLIASAIVYIMLYSVVYKAVRVLPNTSRANPRTEEVRVVGGLWLRESAKKRLNRKGGPETVQELFEGAAYDKDLLWDKSVQQLSKALFAIGYLGLTTTGTVALGVTSILVALKMANP
ncbi:MAG TPA: hypothetical protein VEG32_05865 [Clostridia bacterium]|nr:hypothetical protein [Clostridia bacterium]